MNTAPPWSRRFATQPKRMTSSPRFFEVNAPQEWVRLSSRMKSATRFPLPRLRRRPGQRLSFDDGSAPGATDASRCGYYEMGASGIAEESKKRALPRPLGPRLSRLAPSLHTLRCMSRLFLSGQTTCALLLGAGLLLRAQAALRFEPEPVQMPQRAAKSAFEHEAAQPAGRAMGPDGHAPARVGRPLGKSRSLRAAPDQSVARSGAQDPAEHAVSHSRKARAQGRRAAGDLRCGDPLADGANQDLAPQGKRCN